MAKMMSFRLPDETADRLKTLARPGESQASVVLRGLDALEGHGEDEEPKHSQGCQSQIEALTARVEALETAIAPSEDTGSDYPLAVRAGAVALQAAGRPSAEIRRAIEQACGRTPSPKHISTTLKRWAGQLENGG